MVRGADIAAPRHLSKCHEEKLSWELRLIEDTIGNTMDKSDPRSPLRHDTLAATATLDEIRLAGVPIVELFRSAPCGDYRAHVEVWRALIVLSQDPDAFGNFARDVLRTAESAGALSEPEEFQQRFQRKDTSDRFERLQEERRDVLHAQPSLLSGYDFDECLAQYKVLIAHVESLWDAACNLYAQDNHPLATFLSILVIEEIGKLTNLFTDLLFFDMERPTPLSQSVDNNHKRKQLIGVFSGALVNARLDRVLGFDTVSKLLNLAQSKGLENLRQDCLYVSMQDGCATTPRERIGAEQARHLAVFAGEVMAEVLGHFSWEFERMLDSVIAFERSIGMPEKKFERR